MARIFKSHGNLNCNLNGTYMRKPCKTPMMLNPEASIFTPGREKINNEHLNLEIPDVHLVSQGKSTQPILNSPMLNRPYISLLHTPHETDPCMINVDASPNIESSSETELFCYSNSGEDDHYAGSLLNNMRLKNLNKLIIGHLNINSIRRKFEALKAFVKNNLDILVVSETKLDHTFPFNQFCMEGYRLIRKDRK